MLRKDIDSFINSLPKDVVLVAATKYISAEQIEELAEHGIFDYGENRVDSFLEKESCLKGKIPAKWHFIGHLQTNKALKVIDKIDYLHSLDSLKLAKMINENRKEPLKCFVEISINNEESKNGVKLGDISSFFNDVLKYEKVEIVGLMMMAKADSDHESLIKQFTSLKDIKNLIEEKFQIKIPYISMGMSEDYLEAIECGATHIRLGRILYKQ